MWPDFVFVFVFLRVMYIYVRVLKNWPTTAKSFKYLHQTLYYMLLKTKQDMCVYDSKFSPIPYGF